MTAIMDRFSLKDRVALVTGASGDFGAFFARTLGEAGARVVCAARRADKLDSVVKGLAADGIEATSVSIDVGDTAAIAKAFDAAEHAFGTVDVLVNNAGLSDVAPVPEMTEQQWQQVIDTNLSGPWRVSSEMARRLVAAGKGGSIVNIASIMGLLAKPMFSNYGTSKAGLMHLTRQLAIDLLPHGIRVNALAPGFFPTEMTNWFFETDAGKAEIANLPPQRLGRIEELAGPLLLLASEASSYMNGSVVNVDYGHASRLS